MVNAVQTKSCRKLSNSFGRLLLTWSMQFKQKAVESFQTVLDGCYWHGQCSSNKKPSKAFKQFWTAVTDMVNAVQTKSCRKLSNSFGRLLLTWSMQFKQKAVESFQTVLDGCYWHGQCSSNKKPSKAFKQFRTAVTDMVNAIQTKSCLKLSNSFGRLLLTWSMQFKQKAVESFQTVLDGCYWHGQCSSNKKLSKAFKQFRTAVIDNF